MDEQHQNAVTWRIALALACIGIVGYGAFYSTNGVSDPAFLAGQYLVYAFVAWLVFYAVFLRKLGQKIGAIAFFSLYAAMFAGGLIAASKQERQAVSALSSIQQQVGDYAKSAMDPSGALTPVERTQTVTIARGDFGEMERFMKAHIDRIVALRNDYLLELSAIGWESILAPQRLKMDTTFSESRVMTGRAKVIVEKYERKHAELLSHAREQIEALSMSEAHKATMLRGFDQGMSKSADRNSEIWVLEKQALAETQKIIDLLAASRWVIDGEQILFYREDDLLRYNARMAAIQGVLNRQEQLQKSAFAEIDSNLETLKGSMSR